MYKKFSRRPGATWEHISNSTPYRLHADGSPEGALSKRGSGIAEIIL